MLYFRHFASTLQWGVQLDRLLSAMSHAGACQAAYQAACATEHTPVIHSVISLSYLPTKIVYSSIISPLILLYFKVGNFSFRNLSS